MKEGALWALTGAVLRGASPRGRHGRAGGPGNADPLRLRGHRDKGDGCARGLGGDGGAATWLVGRGQGVQGACGSKEVWLHVIGISDLIPGGCLVFRWWWR
ncbi:hypothetical protein D1007_32764 [Hordeum vulgare]|nr:hypothetical protein D1007_32764 [Hordeum vulgare]